MAALDNVVMVGPWGRTGGTFWKHELRDINAQYTAIIIRIGAMGIDSIDVKSVENRDNIEHHPERSDDEYIIITLGPDEFIKDYTFGFSEQDAKYLSWLCFVTNLGVYGPFGPETTSKFSLIVTKGKLVGFFGWNELNEGPISSVGVELADSDNKVMVGPWGLTDGPFWENVIPDPNHRVSKIIIRYGARIDFITVESNEKPDINKDNIKHHPKRSGDIENISLDPDEFITEFFIYVEPESKYLSALGFITNKNMYGPYGTVTTSVFPVPVTKDKLLGFFGNNEVPINSIGFVFAP